MNIRRLSAGLAGMAIAASVFMVSAPAHADGAPTLEDGYGLFALDCFEDAHGAFAIDSATAVATPIGDATENTSSCAGNSAYNPIDGKTYFTEWGSSPQRIWSVDLATGATAQAVTIVTYDGRPVGVSALAFSASGDAYVVTRDDSFGEGDGRNRLFSLDMATGELTYIAIVGEAGERFYSLTRGLEGWYVMSTTGVVSMIDMQTGELDSLYIFSNPDVVNQSWAGLVVDDANGIFWAISTTDSFSLWAGEGESGMRVGALRRDPADPASGLDAYAMVLALLPSTPTDPVDPTDPADPVDEGSDIPAPAPASAGHTRLAETGVNESATGVALGAGVLALLLGGAALSVARARRKVRA